MKSRSRRLTACLFTLTLYITPAQAGNPEPSSLQSTEDVPTCYLKTQDGKTIDLSQKCGFIKPAACGTTLGSASRDTVLTDFCRQNQRCALTNTCNTMPRGVNTPPGTPMGSRPLFKLWA
jgi:hypothetical protein